MHTEWSPDIFIFIHYPTLSVSISSFSSKSLIREEKKSLLMVLTQRPGETAQPAWVPAPEGSVITAPGRGGTR